MPNEVRIRTSVKDEASKPIKDLQDAFERLKGPAGTAGVVMGLTAAATSKAFDLAGEAVSKTVEFLGDSVKAAAEEEAGVAKMTAALKANVTGWDGNTEAINKRIDAGVRLAFSDDDVRASFTTLVSATHDVNKAFELQQTAMDLSRLKGISLQDASTALVRVEGGQYRMLKQLGIVLKDGATQTEALAAVQKVAAGQAAAYADTLAGKTDQLNARFEQIKEKVGGAVVPTLNDLAGGLVDVADATDGAADSSDKFQSGVIRLGAAITGIVMPGGAMTRQFRDAAAAIDRTDAAAAALQAQVDRNRAVWDDYKRAQNDARLGMPAVEGSLKTLSSTLSHANAVVYTGTERLRDWGDQLDAVAKKAGDDQFSVQELGDQFQIATDSVKSDIEALQKLQAIKNPTAAQRDDLAKTDLQVIADKRSIIDLGSRMLAAKQISFASLIAQFEKLGIKLYDDNGHANDLLKTLRYISGMSGNGGGGTSGSGGHGQTPRAAGGPVTGGTYLVGENGPEMLHLSGSQSGWVNPSPSGASGGGASLTINVQTPLLTPGAAQALADAIAPHVTKWQQQRGL